MLIIQQTIEDEKRNEEIEMYENKDMFMFFYILLGVASIIIKDPIIQMISLIMVIIIIAYKIKLAKKSPEGFKMIVRDLIIIIVIFTIDIAFLAMEMSVNTETNKYDNSSNSNQEITIS